MSLSVASQIDMEPQTERSCLHCGEECPDLHSSFCCLGCKSAYQFIHSKNLQEYYQWKKEKGPKANAVNEENFADYDHPELKKEYLQLTPSGLFEFKLYLEGIHCLGCLWILEKTSEQFEEVHSTSLDMSQQTLSLLLSEKQQLSELIFFISSLGYKCTPLKYSEDIQKRIQAEKRSSTTKLGVTAALTGNIMLLSAAVYSGAELEYQGIFHGLSALLCFGILIYSATDFYRESMRAWIQKRFSVDYALSFAIVVGYFVSLGNLFQSSTHLYFDSIASLCFLILLSRYLLKYSQWKHLSRPSTSTSISPLLASKILENGEEQKILPQAILVGDQIRIKSGERVPCDGQLMQSSALFDESFLTGEAEPKEKKYLDPILAGSLNLSPQAKEILCIQTQGNSQVFQSYPLTRSLHSFAYKRDAERNAKILSIISLVFSFGSLAYHLVQGTPVTGVESFLAILIITCPCAFALANPLVLQRGLDFLDKLGILVKNADSIEKLEKLNKIYFDKTGTLTMDYFHLDHIEILSEHSSKEILQLLLDLERHSKHPIAKSIRNYISQIEPLLSPREDFHSFEEIGRGVFGKWNNKNYYLEETSLPKSDSDIELKKTFYLKEEGRILARVHMRNPLRPGTKPMIEELISKGYELHILSGDKKAAVQKLAKDLAINGTAHSELSPQQKADLLPANSIYIGDGANDSLALEKALVGIATQGSIDTAFRSAQLYLDRCQIDKLPRLLELAKSLGRVRRGNFVISLCYNFIFILLASFSFISPLVAAIIMPLSSLILVLRTLYFTSYKEDTSLTIGRQKWKYSAS